MPKLFGKHLTRDQIREYTGNLGQIAGITPFQLTDGRGAGVDALRLQNGSGLDVTILAGRALDISDATFDGMSLCWHSCTGDAAASYYEPEGMGWLRTFFGGLLTTCGLTGFGPPVDDEFGSVGQHGRINALPSEDVGWSETWDGDECTFEIRGTTREARVFGENLSLRRRIWTKLGSTSLWLEDIVTNEGFTRTPHMILYHCNAGFPLVDAGAQLYVSHSSMKPRDDEASKGMEEWGKVTSPEPGFKEQVFIHDATPCSSGRAAALLRNPNLNHWEGLALAIRFDPRQLPALISWRMMGQGNYVMGIEPANTPAIQGRAYAARTGTLPFLEGGESRKYELEFQVLIGRDPIDGVIKDIEAANAGR